MTNRRILLQALFWLKKVWISEFRIYIYTHTFMNNYFQMLYFKWDSDHSSARLHRANGETQPGVVTGILWDPSVLLISSFYQGSCDWLLVGLLSHWSYSCYKLPWSRDYLLIVFLRVFASSQLPQKNSSWLHNRIGMPALCICRLGLPWALL